MALAIRKCPVCANADNLTVHHDIQQEGNSFIFCKKCGHGFCSKLAFPEEKDQVSFNQEAFFGKEGEPFLTWADFSGTHEPSARWHCEHFKKYRAGKKLLEIGCGLGGFLKYAKEYADFDCYANDISPKATRFVEEKLNIKTTTGAFVKELYPSQKFDIIFLSHVIEHIPDPMAFVRNLRAICSPNAIVAIVCPNDASFCSSIKRQILFPLRKTHEYGQMHWPMHLNGFTPRSLRCLFTTNGYKAVLETTWSRVQKEAGYEKSILRDTVLFPVYLAEYFFNRGGLIVSYFRLDTP